MVCERGWLHLRATDSENNLAKEVLDVALLLGEPMKCRNGTVVESLVPLHAEHANTNSLSMQHGFGAFPLHIDGAHLSQPPRFLLLACVSPGFPPVPTTLVHFHKLNLLEVERQLCESAPFHVRNGRWSFYSSILVRSRPFVRFDQGCMKPMFADGRRAMTAITLRAAELGPTVFNWKARDILIIDNWRVLHGRGLPSSVASLDRHILRVSIQ